MKFITILLILFVSTLFIACGVEKTADNTNADNTRTETPMTENTNSDDTATENTNSDNTTDETPKPEEKPETSETKLLTPKDSISYQFELIKAGDFDNLKECLTDRVKGNLTKEIVDKAKEDSAKYTMEDLVSTIEEGEADGKETAKIMMKNGRTLTTLVKTDGKWLADTIWFKNN